MFGSLSTSCVTSSDQVPEAIFPPSPVFAVKLLSAAKKASLCAGLKNRAELSD